VPKTHLIHPLIDCIQLSGSISKTFWLHSGSSSLSAVKSCVLADSAKPLSSFELKLSALAIDSGYDTLGPSTLINQKRPKASRECNNCNSPSESIQKRDAWFKPVRTATRSPRGRIRSSRRRLRGSTAAGPTYGGSCTSCRYGLTNL